MSAQSHATILITGAASGIGRAVALRAASTGAQLALLDINRGALEGVAAEATEAGASGVVSAPCDITDETTVTSAFSLVDRQFGPVTGVFANAGIEVNEPFDEMSLETWSAVVSTNLTGTFLVCREAVRHMKRHGSGAIVCTSSPAAFLGFIGGGNAAYAASKGGISALVRSLAVDYASVGVRVNAVVPGATDTPMLLVGTSEDAAQERRRYIEHAAAEEIPAGRLGTAAEVAEAVLWLLSDQASYVTGAHLACDGGLMARSANSF